MTELPERSYGTDCRIYLPENPASSWASGALNPERDASGDVVTSVKSYFNIAGIWAGMHTVRYFDGKAYKWVGLSRQPNIIGKVKRTLGQSTTAQWDKDEWHPLQGPWRFIQ
ncbi:hypothetical protein TSUD_49660, partial [Trifolium subterraneum]